MISDEETPAFPYGLVWEEFDPKQTIDWQRLEADYETYEGLFSLGKVGDYELPKVDVEVLKNLSKHVLDTPPSASFIHKLYILAVWQVTGEFRRRVGIDLEAQQPRLKSLQLAAFALWEAANRISGHVEAVLPWMHSVEPDRLMPEGSKLNISEIGTAAYDLSLVAARAYRETRAKKTGRRPEFRRDTTVRLAAEAIEQETGERITTSRGNKGNPAPHFGNAGGRLLSDFFKLIDPKIDEALLVHSLGRSRKSAKVQKNAPVRG